MLRFEPLTLEHRDLVEDYLRRVPERTARMLEAAGMTLAENRAIKSALHDFQSLDLFGGAIRPGLRKAKMSYRPHHMVVKYAATFEPAMAGRFVGGQTEGRCRE